MLNSIKPLLTLRDQCAIQGWTKNFFPQPFQYLPYVNSEISLDDLIKLYKLLLENINVIHRYMFSFIDEFCNSTLFEFLSELYTLQIQDTFFKPEFFKQIANAPYLKDLLEILQFMQAKKMLDNKDFESNLSLILEAQNWNDLKWALLNIQNQNFFLENPTFYLMMLTNHKKPSAIASGLFLLDANKLLDSEHHQIVIDALLLAVNTEWIAEAMIHLNKSQQLHQADHLQILISHPNPSQLANVIVNLPLIEPNLSSFKELITNHSKPESMLHSLCVLNEIGFLNYKNPNFVALMFEQDDPFTLANCLWLLKKSAFLDNDFLVHNLSFILEAQHNSRFSILLIHLKNKKLLHLLTPESFNFIKITPHYKEVENIFEIVNKASFFDSPARVKALFSHPKLFSLIESIKNIITHINPDLLSEKHWNLLLHSNQPEFSASLLLLLQRCNLLNYAKIIFKQRSPEKTFSILSKLESEGIFHPEHAEQNLRSLLQHQNFLIEDENYQQWLRIPPGRLNQTQFNLIIELANHHEHQPNNHAFENYIDGLLQNNLQVQAYNHQQTTHTASIHNSVSVSANKLKLHYETILDEHGVNSIIDQIKLYLHSLYTIKTHYLSLEKVAERCLENINNYYYEDPSSKISLKELLAIFWIAIHDKENVLASDYREARKILLEGLYEIQRGGNLNHNNIDNHLNDSTICFSGSFNKLMEKMVGLHPLVHIEFLDKTSASAKFRLIVQEECIIYLKGQQKFQNFPRLFAKVKELGVEAIYEEIFPTIKQRMLEEFGSLYKNEEDPELVALFSQAIYIDLEDLNQFECEKSNSSDFSFFHAANQHTPATQIMQFHNN